MRLVIVAAASLLLSGCYYPYYPPPQTAPTSQPVVWSNPEAGTSGTATPQPAGQGSASQCREFQSTVTVDGRPQAVWGVVCRQADGSWRLVN